MSRKRTSKSLENDVKDEEQDGYGDFIGIKSKNFKDLFSSDNLRRKDLKLGTLLLGIVDRVNEKEVTISLPGLNTAVVSQENTLEEGILESSGYDLTKLSLLDRFRVGDVVNGAIVSNNKIKNNITLKPSILNAGINSNSKCLQINGYVISSIIISKESRGYYLYTGIKDIKTVFMKYEDPEYEYRLGQILPVAINKYYKDKSLLICTSIYEENYETKIGKNELLSIHEIKPGLKVECIIHSFGKNSIHGKSLNPKKKRKTMPDKINVQPNTKILQLENIDKRYINDEELSLIQDHLQDDHSIYVSFCMGTMIGVIPNEHSIHPLSCFYKEFETCISTKLIKNLSYSKPITARIIAVLSDSTNKIILSILPHNIHLSNKRSLMIENISTGTIISSLESHDKGTLKSLCNISFCDEYKKNQNRVKNAHFLSYIKLELNQKKNNWFSIYTTSFNKDATDINRIIKTQPCRVISHSRIENSLLVTFDPKIIQEKYFCILDVAPAQIVQAKVLEIHKWGLSVRLSEYFSGRVYMEHLFNNSNSLMNSKKAISKQIDYLKKHYQIGRSYRFKVLRYEYSDNSWNPLLLLTSKQLLLNDELPAIRSIDESLKVGQIATGYISRIYSDHHSDKNADVNFYKGDYIIIRFYGEAYGSISYKEYINFFEDLEVEGISKIPSIGEVVTVQIKSIDLITKSLKLSLYSPKDQQSDNNHLAQFQKQVEQLGNYNYFNNLFINKINDSNILLTVCYQGLLFIQNKELFYVPKYSISDDKINSESIFNLVLKLYRSSRTVEELNQLLKDLDFELITLTNKIVKQKVEVILLDHEKDKLLVTLNTKIAYMKYSLRNQEFRQVMKGDICWGYVSHLDHYGLLLSINKKYSDNKFVTGILPRNLISSKIFFDGKEMLKNHFDINESLMLKVVDIDEQEKKVALNLKDLENEPFSEDYCKLIQQKFNGYKEDQFLIQKLINNKQCKISSYIIGKVIKFDIDEIVDKDEILAFISIKKIKQKIRLKILGNNRYQIVSNSKDIYGFVLGGYLSQKVQDDLDYIYYVYCNEDFIDVNKKTDNAKISLCNNLIKKMILDKKNLKINGENIILSNKQLTLLSLKVNVKSMLDKVDGFENITDFPIIIYTNTLANLGSKNSEFNCRLIDFFDQNIRTEIPILIGVINKTEIKNKRNSNNLSINEKIKCKIIDHMKMYEGIIVQLHDKSYGRVQILELDDDKIDKPLSLDKYQKGQIINGIIINQILGKKRVPINNSQQNRTKYVQLIWEISTKISRIRDINDINESDVISNISQIKQGSILSGYVSYSGKEGVFVRIGLDLIGRIKLRELTTGTITPEDASRIFYVGKFIRQMVVVNIENNKIDLSISKLESDDIKLRLSQIEFNEEPVEIVKSESNTKTDEGNISSIENFNEKLEFEDLFIGRILAGVIKNISHKHGLFIKLTDLRDNTALCKISECLDTECDGETISSIFNIGDNVLCKIINLDLEKKRIWVGIKPSYFTDYNKNDEHEIDKIEDIVIENSNDNLNYETKEKIDIELNDEDLDYMHVESIDSSEKISESNHDIFDIKKDKIEVQAKNLNRKQKVLKQLEREHKIRQEEEKGMNSHLNPSSVDDYERMLITHKDVSSLWIKYMSYYLDLGNLDKARLIAERSLKQISVKEEMERWNAWMAYINMEIVYGNANLKDSTYINQNLIPKNIKDIIDRALMNVYDQKKLYIQVFNSFKKYSNEELGLSLIEEGLKKFPTSRKLWISYLTSFYENNNQKKARDEIIQKSLKSVSKHKVIRLITDIGRLEFEYGNINRGRTIFENLLEENSKRMDLWSQYFDILTKLCINNKNDNQYIDMARSVYESCMEKDFKPRNMKMIFTRWLSFEKQFGSVLNQKHVQELAINYVNKIEASL